MGIIRLSESFLESAILRENNNLKTSGYKMLSEDHHNKVKREELRSLIREAVPVRNFSNSYLSKRLTLEVTVDNEKDYVIALYGSLTQISNKFWLFWNFDSYFVVLLVDFNAKLNAWLVNHTNIWEGKLDLNLENSTSMYGMKQLISPPTHFLQHQTHHLKLHWPYFRQPAKLSYKVWYSPIITPKLSSSSYILKIEYPVTYACKV